jgi:biotin carboxylase
MRKKLMLLGGIRYLLPVIETAHKLGCHVITVDYIPDNIAHRYSDEYHNVSILDQQAVLNLAQDLKIDGIMSFGVDPGVITAAYVQEKMGLPSQGPYESIRILQNKDKFRAFLSEHNFNVPKSKCYMAVKTALNDTFEYPIIVKPTDSAGSKGVTRVNNRLGLEYAVRHAFDNSHCGKIIIEDFIEKEGCSTDSDCFSINGKLAFVSYSAQRFDEKAANPFTPSAFSWPSTMTESQENELTLELQRLLDLLHMQTSLYNVEARIGKNGKPYLMEVSPRGGGNRLAEMIRYSTGVDLIEAAVLSAIGEDLSPIRTAAYKGYWAEIILHADQKGFFEELLINKAVYNAHIIEKDLWVSKGDVVSSFNGANDTIGTLVVKFEKQENLYNALSHIEDWIKIIVI